MRTNRQTAALAAVLGALLLTAPPAGAQTTTSVVDEAVDALATDPVYVHPDASEQLSASDAEEVRDAIRSSQAGPVYVAVLPEDAVDATGGSVDALIETLHDELGRDGTYVVVAGNSLRAGSTEFAPGVVPSIASEAVEENQGESAGTVLLALVEGLDAEATGEASGDEGGSAFGFGLLPLLLLGGLGFFALSAARRRRREREEHARQLEEVRETALEDLVALGEDLRALDVDVEMPDADPAAKRHYVKALSAYESATAELDRVRSLDEVARVTSILEEGRYELVCARAALNGERMPQRLAPCFFDPRHGPSVVDVEWAPPGGAPRAVPACADDARRVRAGEEPMTREVMVGGAMTPFFNAPGYYGPWLGGYYGGFGGLLPGLLLGSMLGGGFGFGPFGWGMGGFGYGDAGAGEGGDMGDFGADFGGGDFGGGDFGGGDF
ncbi:MAG TPA: hypothetical protein VHJ34_09770 [Actinomycetota bacterium]|nr:hypothetical protein [Actinomycetota bacterium]